VRIQNLSFASYLYISLSLLLIQLNSSAFAFQSLAVENNSASISSNSLKSPQKNQCQHVTKSHSNQLEPTKSRAKNCACATRERVG
jgi:hypothetical protein